MLRPAFALPTSDGGAGVGPAQLRAAGLPVLLVFAGGEDPAGLALVDRVARWQREHGGELTVALVAARAGRTALVRAADRADVCTVLLDDLGVAARVCRVRRTPAAVLLEPDGALAGPPAYGPAAIERLVRSALRHARPAAGLAVGTLAPRGVVRDEGGAAVALRELLGGEPAVLLLWDPGCARCDDACADLLAWPEDGPRLIAVAPAPDDRLPAPVLVDPGGRVAAALGGHAPAAVLLDGAGRVAAPLARGADAILTLARA